MCKPARSRFFMSCMWRAQFLEHPTSSARARLSTYYTVSLLKPSSLTTEVSSLTTEVSSLTTVYARESVVADDMGVVADDMGVVADDRGVVADDRGVVVDDGLGAQKRRR